MYTKEDGQIVRFSKVKKKKAKTKQTEKETMGYTHNPDSQVNITL